jgi:hypothetical protein
MQSFFLPQAVRSLPFLTMLAGVSGFSAIARVPTSYFITVNPFFTATACAPPYRGEEKIIYSVVQERIIREGKKACWKLSF